MQERRRTPRHSQSPRQLSARINGFEGEVIDISPLGAQIETCAALRPASNCHLSLPCGNDTLRLRVRVQRCRALALPDSSDQNRHRLVYRSGLEFVGLGFHERALLFRAYGPAQARAS